MVQPLIERHIAPILADALRDSRAVCLVGPRQAGKSTLARQLVATGVYDAEFLTLDNEATRNAALTDPTGFVAALTRPTIIDEIQRAPDLMLAIKERLDDNQERGQFLLTGSANIMTVPSIRDALPGRIEYVHLWSFSQGELARSRESFVDQLFGGAFPNVVAAPVGRQAYTDITVAGGYPDAYQRTPRSRARFFASYINSIIGQDVSDVAHVRNVADVGRLLRLLATRSAGLISFAGMSRDLGIDDKTVKSHTTVLEDLLLFRRHQPWYTNLGNREIKSPKGYITDSGLLSFLIGADSSRIIREDAIAGLMFETFSVMELVRQADWAEEIATVYHYRDKDGREADAVLERQDGSVIAIEVKSSASVADGDFRGLRHLRAKLGSRFRAGAVLYTGARTLPFGDRLAAVPLRGLWQ